MENNKECVLIFPDGSQIHFKYSKEKLDDCNILFIRYKNEKEVKYSLERKNIVFVKVINDYSEIILTGTFDSHQIRKLINGDDSI